MNEERLKEIETKIAFQEQTIRDLSDVLYRQQREIEKLVKICKALEKQGKEGPALDGPADEKPPHY